MKEVKPVLSLRALESQIDNGGWFYNLGSTALDGEITKGELAKAAGAIFLGQDEILFLEMLQFELPRGAKETLLQQFEPPLQEACERYRPITVKPSVLNRRAEVGDSVIVTGFARFVEARVLLPEFMGAPSSPGSASAPPVEIEDGMLDFFELYDGPGHYGASALIAVPTNAYFGTGQPVRFGGVMCEMTEPTLGRSAFLEVGYFSRVREPALFDPLG